ncbi:MAG: hypothetical protein LC799_11835 [Actinobacteria bacterium]|nr:hypothetical protein [Actinomycetota bacterium]
MPGKRPLWALAELLRCPAEHAKGAALLVVGPFGCGKSSLVRADLLPIMDGGSQPEVMRL